MKDKISTVILVLAVLAAALNGYIALTANTAVLGGSTSDNWSVGGNLSVTGTSVLTGATTITGGLTLGRCGSATWNPGAVGSSTPETTTVTVTGLAAGDPVLVSLDLPLNGLVAVGYASTTNLAAVTLFNPDTDASAVNLATSTVRVCGID